MTQIVSIKKVSIDGDRKVSVLVEFMAANRKGRHNVFSLIEMQGEAVEVSFGIAGQDVRFSADNREPSPEPVGV